MRNVVINPIYTTLQWWYFKQKHLIRVKSQRAIEFFFLCYFFEKYLFPVHGCFAGMRVCAPRACLVPTEGREGSRPPGTGDGCEAPCGCQKSRQGSPWKSDRALSCWLISLATFVFKKKISYLYLCVCMHDCVQRLTYVCGMGIGVQHLGVSALLPSRGD